MLHQVCPAARRGGGAHKGAAFTFPILAEEAELFWLDEEGEVGAEEAAYDSMEELVASALRYVGLGRAYKFAFWAEEAADLVVDILGREDLEVEAWTTPLGEDCADWQWLEAAEMLGMPLRGEVYVTDPKGESAGIPFDCEENGAVALDDDALVEAQGLFGVAE